MKDYRNQYTGDFIFTNQIHYHQNNGFDSTAIETYDGYIELSSLPKRIKIYFFTDKIIEPEIDKTGKFKIEGTLTYALTGTFGNGNTLQFTELAGDQKEFLEFNVNGKRK